MQESSKTYHSAPLPMTMQEPGTRFAQLTCPTQHASQITPVEIGVEKFRRLDVAHMGQMGCMTCQARSDTEAVTSLSLSLEPQLGQELQFCPDPSFQPTSSGFASLKTIKTPCTWHCRSC